MMISPTSYVEMLKGKSYPDLIRERDRLIRYMWKYEQDEKAGDRSDPEWGMCPQPVVKYQVYFDYLAAICDLMHRKYNEEYVCGKRTLEQDAEKTCEKKAGIVDTRKAEQDFNATLELLKGIYGSESQS